jgi:hypothetical protein
MADYKELIRKAIQALPENNGAARRAVYEKARAALVGQLRGLNPPLAARDITQHRLQLEDCIRQVEQEASEAVIAGLKQNEDLALAPPSPALPPPRPASTRPTASSTRPSAASSSSARNGAPPPLTRSTAAPSARPGTLSATPRAATAAPSSNGSAPRPAAPRPAPPAAVPRIAAVQTKPVASASSMRSAGAARSAVRAQPAVFPRAVPLPEPEPEPEPEFEPETIEDIIAAAENDLVDPVAVDEMEDEPVEELPAPPMFKLEARQPRRAAAAPAPAAEPRAESRPVPAIVARAEAAKAGRTTSRNAEPARRANGRNARQEPPAPPARPQITHRQQNFEPIQLPRPAPANTAMSRVREVDLENGPEGDPQVAIERAIATLEREARNDDEEEINGYEEELPSRPTPGRRRSQPDKGFREQSGGEAAFARGPVENERGGGSAVTIFLLVFVVLLVAVGGGGFWAWREGFIDFDAMFGKSPATTQQAAHPAAGAAPAPVASAAPQTNTEAAPNTTSQASEALSAAPAAGASQAPAAATASAPAATPVPAATAAAEPSAQSAGAPKSEERLTQTAEAPGAPAAADVAKPAEAGAVASGNQSLLLEASQDGTTGAVPFSGTVEWSKGTDEMGQPTLVGKANIPARNLGVSVLIRKNSDPTLPASHLMEINFSVTDSFIGGAISGLPGVLLKNEELVQGTPLVGASARVVGNSFLFALSSSPADEQTNKDLLTSRKWMDLAIIYATGKKAIITLEKDDKTQQMFNDVFAAWSKTAAAAPAAPKG